MSLSNREIIIVFLFSLAVFVVGYFSWSSFFLLLLPVENGVSYFVTDLGMPFWDSLVFGLTLAFVPPATVLVWKFAPVFNSRRKVLTVCIIVIAMIVSVIIRREVIRSQLRILKPLTAVDHQDPGSQVEKSIETGFPLTDVKFEYFALVGVIAGSVFSLFVLREKEK